jgi:hypothetical protein
MILLTFISRAPSITKFSILPGLALAFESLTLTGISTSKRKQPAKSWESNRMASPGKISLEEKAGKSLTRSGKLLNRQGFHAQPSPPSKHISPSPKGLPLDQKTHFVAAHLPKSDEMAFERQPEPSLEKPRVLILGDGERTLSGMAQTLQQWGCQCFLVESEEAARQLLSQQTFDLVLAVNRRSPIGASLAMAIRGTDASLFRAVPVEDSCWWVPVLREGRECVGEPALRPTEFAGLVQEMVYEWKRPGKVPLEKSLASPPEHDPIGKSASRTNAGHGRQQPPLASGNLL